MTRLPFVLTFAALSALAAPASADLRACNQTDEVISVAIGYKDGDSWNSEGWWTMRPGDCKIMIDGDLKSRYYYWRVTQNGVALPTEEYSFCTSTKVFTIIGDTDCEARGHDSAMFSQVDTGDARTYTINVAGNAASPQTDPEPEPEPDPTDGFADIRATLQGRWADAEDSGFETIIRGDRLTDAYAGVTGAQATWRLATTCRGADDAGPVMLVKYDDTDEDDLCWILKGLNDRELLFRAVGGSKDIYMLKQ